MKIALISLFLLSLSFKLAEAQTTDFEREVADSKLAAIREFPELKDPSSSLALYVKEATRRWPKINPDSFTKDSNWPLLLARFSAQRLRQQQQAIQPPNQQNPNPRPAKSAGNDDNSLTPEQAAELLIGYKRALDQQTIQLLEAKKALLLANQRKLSSRDANEIERIDKALAIFRAFAENGANQPKQPLEGNAIESHIKGTFNGWTGETLFPLENGQIWQQSQYAYNYYYAFQPAVKISSSNGTWMLKVSGIEQTIAVRRIK
jgi:hypothetical protein